MNDTAGDDDDILPCAWCGIAGQQLDDPHAAHLVSLNTIEPYGALCEICYNAPQPPHYEYLAMVIGHPIKKIQEISNLIAEFAYEACGVFANQRDTRYK